MLITKYVRMPVNMVDRRYSERAPVFQIYLQSWTHNTLCNFAPLLKAHVLTATLRKDYCTRKGCKCNSSHTKTLPSSFSCPPWPAVEIILCQILNRTCESTQHCVEPALASELMRSQRNHSPRLCNTMFSRHLLVQRQFPIYYRRTH